jgi:hypothetical protein
MTPQFILSIVLALALVALVGAWSKGFLRGGLVSFGNVAEGTHAGNITKKSDAAIATRFLLVKKGSDVNHIAVAGGADIPLGICTDEAAAAEDLVNVNLLGSIRDTQLAVAAAAITSGAFVVCDATATGKVRTLPGSAGTYYIVGRALTDAGADGDLVEIDPIPCVQRVV